jgi:uncharacterized protein YjbI with pentapeptide repeats
MEIILKKINGEELIKGKYSNIIDLLEENRKVDLRGADLQGAYLRGAYLRGAKNEKIEIKNTIITIQNLDYVIMIFSGYIKIGCQQHKLELWENFADEEIIKMDGKKAIKFWREWKNILIEMCRKENEKIWDGLI